MATALIARGTEHLAYEPETLWLELLRDVPYLYPPNLRQEPTCRGTGWTSHPTSTRIQFEMAPRVPWVRWFLTLSPSTASAFTYEVGRLRFWIAPTRGGDQWCSSSRPSGDSLRLELAGICRRDEAAGGLGKTGGLGCRWDMIFWCLDSLT
jgi:hypothetical protein